LLFQYQKLKHALEKEFPGQLEFEYYATPTVTGYFEVKIVSTGKLLHSKKNGDGYVDNDAKLKKIFEGIKDELAQGN